MPPCPSRPEIALPHSRSHRKALGRLLGDLAARRGRVTGSVSRAGAAVVTATVPLAELFGYATRLRSRTQGRGTFTARPTGYAPAPVATPVR